MKYYIIGALLLCTITLFLLWRNRVNEAQRLAYNQSVLLDSIEHYTTRDSLNAVSLGILNIKLRELKQYRAQDAQTIRELGIKLRRVENISKVMTESNYTVEITKPQGDNMWQYLSEWIKLTAQKKQDTLLTEIVVYDTIVQVLHRVPRFRFLGISFGTRGVRQEIISRNPHTNIVAAEFLSIVK